jgi:spoIIIJ-associated protein
MSQSLEFEDKNIEMAVKKACEELNIPREKLKHDVISYGSTGIFGLVGSKKAKIRVIMPDPVPEDRGGTSEGKRQDTRLFEEDLDNKEPSIEAEHDEAVVHVDSNDPRDVGQNALQRIIDFITTDATISIEEGSDRIYFKVQGGNAAVLIGKRGQTLEAIQYLVEKIINRNREERVRIQVDVEGYLENRRINLEKIASRMAEKVKRTGKPANIGQMNAHDRRIVHIALKDDSGVRTQSVGEGFLRKLVIFPKKNLSRQRKHK